VAVRRFGFVVAIGNTHDDHLVVSKRYDTRCYFNVRSKADMNRLNLPHGDDN